MVAIADAIFDFKLTIVTNSHQKFLSKRVWVIWEELLKMPGVDEIATRENLIKTLGVGGGGAPPTAPKCTSEFLSGWSW